MPCRAGAMLLGTLFAPILDFKDVPLNNRT
jgi:hypothetical protein